MSIPKQLFWEHVFIWIDADKWNFWVVQQISM